MYILIINDNLTMKNVFRIYISTLVYSSTEIRVLEWSRVEYQLLPLFWSGVLVIWSRIE